ncbi:MAG: VOC family protein [Gemmatimonadota bacterium]
MTLNAISLTPNITANDLEKSIQFYTAGLGFEVEQRHEHEGRLVYVSLRAGNASLGIGQDDFAKGKDRRKGVGQRLWIATEQDLDALAARVKAAGIKLDTEPQPLDWGGRAFSVTDPDGFAISVATS